MKGSCRCGSIQYQYIGQPENVILCFCTECQIRTGSDRWFGAWIKKENFRFTKGSPNIVELVGDSGSQVNSMFCGKSGTPIGAEITVGDFYSISVKTMENAESLKPKMSIYTKSAPKWSVIPDNIPSFKTIPKK